MSPDREALAALLELGDDRADPCSWLGLADWLLARGVRLAPREPSEAAIEAAAIELHNRADLPEPPATFWDNSYEGLRIYYRGEAKALLRAAYAIDGGGD